MGMSESLASFVRPTFGDDAQAASLTHNSGRIVLICPYTFRESHCSPRPAPVSRTAALRPRLISAHLGRCLLLRTLAHIRVVDNALCQLGKKAQLGRLLYVL